MKEEYIKSQLALGKTHSQIIAEQPTELVQGSLLRSHYQEIKTILASGLRLHMRTFDANTPEKLAALVALEETFDPEYMASQDFKVNFNVPRVYAQYQFCIQTGALPQEFADELINLAKYNKSVYNITQEDFKGEFNYLPVRTSSELVFKLNQSAPEPTAIIIESREVYDSGYGEWRYNTSSYVHKAGVYRVPIRNESGRQEVRWSCAYALDVEVG